MSERSEQAVQLKHSGYNCCQAVIKALLPEGDDTLLQAAAGFAVGMGCMECTCGALCGAVMAAGVAGGNARTAKLMLSSFKEMCGAIVCHELKGRDTGKVLCDCDSCVRNAVLCYESVVEGK
jgi:hypothetical protein